MSIKFFGAMPLAAYAVPSPIKTTIPAKPSSTTALTAAAKAAVTVSPVATSTKTTVATSSSASPAASTAKSSTTTSAVATAVKTSSSTVNASSTPSKIVSTSVAAIRTLPTVVTGTKSASVSTAMPSVLTYKSSLGTLYTSRGKLLTQALPSGSKINVSVTATTPTVGISSSPTNKTNAQTATTAPSRTSTANEQILIAKQLYDNALELGDKAGMNTASKLAEQARLNGGSISANVTLAEAREMVANEKILQAKIDYAAAEKNGNAAGIKAAKEAADLARQSGGTIAASATQEQARIVVANQQIVQAKLDYNLAEAKKNEVGMKAAREAADRARSNGGTISGAVSLQDAQRILEQTKWNGMSSSSPMDIISAEDEAALMKHARENAAGFGLDTQVAKLDKAIVDLDKAIAVVQATNAQTKAMIEELKIQREGLLEDREQAYHLGKWIDKLQEDNDNDMEATRKVIMEIDKLIRDGELSGDRGTKLAEGIYGAYEVQSKLKEDDEQRGTILGQALNGFFSGIWSSIDDTADFVFFALEDPAAAGKQAINGVSETAQTLWDKISNPRATYQDAQQSVHEFNALSDHEKAFAMGFILSQLSPSRRTDILKPSDNKDDGANNVGGSGSSDGVNGSNGIGGAGNLHPNGTPNPTHNAKGERIDNVDVPKVKEPATVAEFMKQEEVAISKYASFRIMKNDISDIARNTGWKEADIEKIKNHLFIEKHKFDNGQVKSFAPDYQQALAWERLMQGNYNKNDILFLNHELFESNYMKKHGVTYEQGHAEAQKYYNWSDSIIQK